MTTRARTQWKPDKLGRYIRQIGWKESSEGGGHSQVKFALGKDLQEAKVREASLSLIWQRYEATRRERRPPWPPFLLEIAKQVAKGEQSIHIRRKPDELHVQYAQRIGRLEMVYPVIKYLPEDQHSFEVGKEALRTLQGMNIDVDDVLPKPVDVEKLRASMAAEQILKDAGLGVKPYSFSSTGPQPLGHGRGNEAVPRTPVPSPQLDSSRPGTFHAALKDYIEWLKEEFFRPELRGISPWGRTQVREAEALIRHHDNCPLAMLDHEGVDSLIGYWRRRPSSKRGNKSVTAASASNYIAALHRFLGWLHRSRKYDWRKPADYEDITTRVAVLPSDGATGPAQVQTFSLNELALLNQYGTPFDRLLLMLGLNCDFGVAEDASLLVQEACLFKAHDPSHQELIGFPTTNGDSFIKRVRRKNGVYGEFLLFPQTVQGLQWALDRRRRQPGFALDARLLLNGSGEPYDKPTEKGNPNRQIQNSLARLIDRINKDDNEIRDLSFGKLRKTGGNLIRQFSDGEVAAVFLCHGESVKRDDLADQYTNRPFGKLFTAIRKVQEYLAPVFEAAGDNAFSPQPQAYTSRKTIDKIIELYEEGIPTGQIAAGVKLSGSTVSRHISRYLKQSRASTECSLTA